MPPLDLYDLLKEIWDPEGYSGCLSSTSFIPFFPHSSFCLPVCCLFPSFQLFFFFDHQHPQSLLWHILPRALHVEQASQNITMPFILNYYNSLEHLCEVLWSCTVKNHRKNSCEWFKFLGRSSAATLKVVLRREKRCRRIFSWSRWVLPHSIRCF